MMKVDLEYVKLLQLIIDSDREVDPDWLETELFAIKSLNMSKKFLQMLDGGKKWTNPTHSSVAYLLHLTDDSPEQEPPVKVISARIEPPDIDTDIEDRRAQEVKDYLVKRWTHSAPITTFTEYKGKGMIRDIARVMGVPLTEVNKATQHFVTFEEYLESEDIRSFRNKYPEIEIIGKKLLGRWKSKSIHAGGVVIADRPLEDILPLESRSNEKILGKGKRMVVTAYGMDDCAELGLIKLDVLKVSELTAINDCLKIIEERTGEKLDLDALDPDDPDVLKEFGLGHTVGIFQVGESSYTHLLKDMGIDNFNDLMASNALVRPGPLTTFTPSYIARKKGEQDVKFEHEMIQEITQETYGLFIYQEQVIKALIQIGQMDPLRADKVRKIIAKKLSKEEFKPYEEEWLAGATPNIGKSLATKLWKSFVNFSGYAFNKSHACDYSMGSYQTMWLKVYYPLEFMYGLLRSEKDKKKITSLILEIKRLGIEILPPDINKSERHFSIDGDALRIGLGNISRLGEGACTEIESQRPFKSYEDFCNRVAARKVNIRIKEILGRVGAFSDFKDFEQQERPEDYYYEYIGYPQNLEINMDIELAYPVVLLEDYKKEELQVIQVLIKSIDRRPDFLMIEVEDLTDSDTFFADKSVELKEGSVVLALCQNKDLIDAVQVAEFIDRVENDSDLNRFEKFLLGEVFTGEEIVYNYDIGKIGDEKALVLPIFVRHHKIKSGNLKGQYMAWMVVTDGEEVARLVLFPKSYKAHSASLQRFNPIIIKKAFTKDGDLTVNEGGLMTVKDFLVRKGVKVG